MKKYFICLGLLITVFTVSVKSQQVYTAQAVLRADGSQEIKATDPSGKVTTITVAKGESIQNKFAPLATKQGTVAATEATNTQVTQQVPVSHQAILNQDGSQQIRMIDKDGKERIITAAKGESIQQKYWDYLQKEKIPCACTPAVTAPVTPPVTATKDPSHQ